MTSSDKLPKILTPLPGPKAVEIVTHDRRYISPSYTRSYPLVAERASGAIVEDVDGNRFLDFSAGIAVCSTGHCHPDVVRAIQAQAASLIHMSGTDFYYAHMPRLAERMERLMNDGRSWRCFFGNSGAEAIEAAMKLARHVTGRYQFIAFQQSFHGRTMGALSLTASKAVQRKGFGPLVPGVTHIPYPNPYRCPLGSRPEEVGGAVLRYLEDVVFKTTVNPDEVAAIVFEAVQGEGGYVVPPADFLPGLEKLARRYGIMLVADEVQCGMGRTGKTFAFQHFNIQPDIVAIAKGIASGMPLGIMMAHAETMIWEPGAHASTFGGNPVSIGAAMETVRLLEGGYTANAATVGAFFKARLIAEISAVPQVGDIRGLGLMIGIDIVRDRQSRAPNTVLRDAIIAECFNRGLLVLGAGSSTIRLSPPLIIDEEQAVCAASILKESIASALAAAA
jgi:4-aminobutyrate aminotransferase